MLRAEVDVAYLQGLDHALRGRIEEPPYMAVFTMLGAFRSLIGSNVSGYTGAANGFHQDRRRFSVEDHEEFGVQGALRIKCADKLMELSHELVEDSGQDKARARSAAEKVDGMYKIGSEAIRLWEISEDTPELVVEATWIKHLPLRKRKVPEEELNSEYSLIGGPVLAAIVGHNLDETTDPVFLARLTHDYLRTELNAVNLYHPDYFAPRLVNKARIS